MTLVATILYGLGTVVEWTFAVIAAEEGSLWSALPFVYGLLFLVFTIRSAEKLGRLKSHTY